MIASIIATFIAPGAASADPVSDKKAQAAALAQKINANAHQVEVLAEQFNGAQYHLSQVQLQLADAERRLTVARADAERNRVALASEAIVAYIHGGVSASPTKSAASGSVDLAVQQGYFRLATGIQADALDQLRKSEQELHQQQVALQAARRDSEAAVSTVASRQQAVQAAAAAGQATLNQVQGDLAVLVAQQQAEIAAQQQAQIKASLVATKAKLDATPNAAAATAAPVASPASATASASAAVAGSVVASTTAPTTAATRTTTAPVTATPTTLAVKIPISVPPIQVPAPSAGAAAAVAFARAQIGKPYQWGGAGPNSFDCSGLTMRAWGAAGVSLPHFARAQYSDTAHVAIADLQPGDLVFYGSDLHHVGLYIGAGQMIEAPSTGQFVRIASIFRSDLQPYGGRPG